MPGVWRPERRNRNIGTSSSGYSKSNDMRIPASWEDKHGNYTLYYERLEVARFQETPIGDFRLKILYEEPRVGHTYGCSPSDVIKVLTLAADLVPSLPDIVAFRQPTRKQRQQHPVWGRFLYFGEFGRHEGAAIILEAQELNAPLSWPKRMSLEDRAEFLRLVEDGHSFTEAKRRFQSTLAEAPIRNTVLYRTLLHELGHWVHYHQEVLNSPTALHENQDIASDLYFSKSVSEREDYAHAFAEKLRQALRQTDEIPFDPLEP
ncbi:MAG: ImmA/IrrE family metallo-endopeptidase [Ruegeria sp.]